MTWARKLTADGVPETKLRAKTWGIDLNAGKFPVILWKMIRSGVFERFPSLKFVGTEVQTGWIPYYLESFDESVLRNRHEWNLPHAAERVLSSQRVRRLRRRRSGAADRYDIGVRQHHVGSGLPPLGEQLARRLRTGPRDPRASRRHPFEIERIMWRNAADMYQLSYDEPAMVGATAGSGSA